MNNFVNKTQHELVSYADIKSYISEPLEYIFIDTERVDNPDGSKSCLEISICNEDGEDIFTTTIKQSPGFKLPDYKINEFNYSDEQLKYSPSFEQVNKTIKHICKNKVVGGWNISADLKWFPQLKMYSYAIRDVMYRFSDVYGNWSPDWGNRSWVSLKNAAYDTGFVLLSGEKFHRARTDARACAHIWRYCEENDLPKPKINGDLILREDAEKLLQLDLCKKEESPEAISANF